MKRRGLEFAVERLQECRERDVSARFAVEARADTNRNILNDLVPELRKFRKRMDDLDIKVSNLVNSRSRDLSAATQDMHDLRVRIEALEPEHLSVPAKPGTYRYPHNKLWVKVKEDC